MPVLGRTGTAVEFCNGMLQMAVAGLPDARKVDLRFGDAARQVQDIGATVRTRDLKRQRLDRGAVHRVPHDRQGQAMAARVLGNAGLASPRFRPGAALGVNPVGGGLTHTHGAPHSVCRFGRCWGLAFQGFEFRRFDLIDFVTQLAPKAGATAFDLA